MPKEKMETAVPDAWPNARANGLVGEPLTTSELNSFTNEEGSKKAELASLVYYLPKWRSYLEGRSGFVGFNWTAALFGWLWCLYRKMYKVAIAVFMLEYAVMIFVIVSAAVFFGERMFTETAVGYAAVPLVRIPLGFLANKFYLRRAVKMISTVRAQAGTVEERLAELRRRGGTSGVALGIGIAINIAIVVVSRL